MDKVPSTNSRKAVKLPGFKSRSNVPVGSISFFPKQDEDISGLDEAVSNFRVSTKTSPMKVPVSSGSASDSKTDCISVSPPDSDRLRASTSPKIMDNFELAVEATAIAEDLTGPVEFENKPLVLDYSDDSETADSVNANEMETTTVNSVDAPSETIDPNLSYATDSTSTPVYRLSPSMSASNVLESILETNVGGSPGRSLAPVRPPPFQPRGSTAPVDAAEIHALLDSFSPPLPNDGTKEWEAPTSLVPGLVPVLDRHELSNQPVVPVDEERLNDRNEPTVLAVSGDSLQRDTHPTLTNVPCKQPDDPGSQRGSEETPSSTGRLIKSSACSVSTGEQSTGKRTRPRDSKISYSSWSNLWRLCLSALVVLLLACIYYFTAFYWGVLFGVSGTLLCAWIRSFLWPPYSSVVHPRCHISGLPLGQLCCSLHCQSPTNTTRSSSDIWWPVYAPAMPLLQSVSIPQLRDLQSLPIPYMQDEDPISSTSTGPLGPGLGFKLDKNDRPVYKGWMNEGGFVVDDDSTVHPCLYVRSSTFHFWLNHLGRFRIGGDFEKVLSSRFYGFPLLSRGVFRQMRLFLIQVKDYDAETHHVSQTHSVFVTLDGTQLRLQRPRRNIQRRSMWNEELPSVSTARFQHQRIYDLVHARVTLLPAGLICKRLWSKKYPIAIVLPNQQNKQVVDTTVRKPSLAVSTSVPNMMGHQPTLIRSSPVRLGPNSAAGLPGTHDHSRSSTPAESFVDDFTVISHSDLNSNTLFLFGRTCREKEAWYRRLRAASLGVPLLWTPQLAAQLFLAGSSSSGGSAGMDNRSDEETRSGLDCATDSNVELLGCSSEKTSTPTSLTQFGIPGSREPLYVTYIRYMAKFMPASWLLRSTQALRLNVNHISCEPSLIWLNALLGRLFWDFLREAYWLERVRDKIQAKLKKIHLPPFISDLIVVGIELGSELPVIRRIGHPFLDAQGLWIELDIAYAGGFSVALETNVNLLRYKQKYRLEREAANLADDISSGGSPPPVPIMGEPNLTQRSSRLGAYISDEEDSADSTTDSDTPVETRPSSMNSVRRSTGSVRPSGLGGLPSVIVKVPEEERAGIADGPLALQSALPSRKRLIRIVDRITRSTYFQKAVDNKLVRSGMELLSNTPIVLEAEIQALGGTLLINIPPPQTDRIWFGFRPNPQLRLKVRPRVGEKAVTMSRILEWIENRVTLEFQRLVVLPNMADVYMPLLLSDVTSGGSN
ncbi:hypothetical protein P879_02495 [Paragonimus westermani]|uniref:SMP-LTD domain-containing protein n=1 Tax=Paragonimus westermani TaxID=34504 RepID=A0A8T0DSB4_9TREM|nr:hypothetical protein P879_02495 [Paragonimus westermani]